jgi:hypothetical protein
MRCVRALRSRAAAINANEPAPAIFAMEIPLAAKQQPSIDAGEQCSVAAKILLITLITDTEVEASAFANVGIATKTFSLTWVGALQA